MGLVAQIVAVQRDIQESRGHLDTGEFGDVGGEPLGEGGSAGGDADQDDAGRVTGVRKRGLFDDLMRDTRDGPADICGGQQFASFRYCAHAYARPPSPPHWTDR
ncbi:Uncharacterised protein [Mycobacteroides abscessus subsp. massiliense]|nr:Uncharacterised protein [Mycobacteroides abscessus subsp. massiliense]